jgi:hypothetical protein
MLVGSKHHSIRWKVGERASNKIFSRISSGKWRTILINSSNDGGAERIMGDLLRCGRQK